MDYQQVSSGETLFVIDASGYETQLETVEKQIENYENNIADLQEEIDTEYTRYSDIDGTVVSAEYATNRMTGEDAGSVVVYNQESMEISINVDELDVDYLEVGMPVSAYRTTSSDTVFYQGELTYLSLEATSSSSGVSTFAATITITPLEGEEFDLSSGVTVYYSIDTSGEETTGESVLAPSTHCAPMTTATICWSRQTAGRTVPLIQRRLEAASPTTPAATMPSRWRRGATTNSMFRFSPV